MNDAGAPVSGGPAAAAVALPLFFKQIEALDSSRHRHLRLKPRETHAFARGSNAIPLTFSEIPRASQEYPIVFAGDGDRLHIVALVGLTDGENLFIGKDGRWQGRYVPAYLRCFPFALGRAAGAGENQFLVAIDPSADTISETEGAALFNDKGERSATLEQLVEFLRHYEAQMELARKFAKAVSELGLLVSVNADVRMKNGTKYEMSGLRVVERGALQRLPDAAKLKLYGSEWLEMIHHHFASLQSLSGLVDRLAEHTGAVPAAA
ncbi:SapC family protein [Nevskia sp.]|uniref:SapC family protein n=1 Tax=Nevskia sp. TaxID=1929292 RepID=UPI0025FAFF24|nr:SapC family protein [Nevskia sp.]